jgi:sulfate adenylyltransferase
VIKPHGSDKLNPLFVYDVDKHHALQKEAQNLPSIVVKSATAGNAVMLGGGYFNPLTGFMNVADIMGTAENMHTCGGVFFPVPVANITDDVSAIAGAPRIALLDPNEEGNPVLAIQHVEAIEELTDEQIETICQKVYGTTDSDHIGVATFKDLGKYVISGPIQVLNFSYFQQDFPDTFRTAVEIRNEIKERGWQSTVAFQTRNPMHRAHEELCRMAQKDLNTDGILIHMLLGKLKKGDIPAPVRDAAIRTMVENYFPANTVMITGYGFDMLYAGPREAVLHALFRQNCGCTHFIIGRDHAGVGDYYGAFEAQTIFDSLLEGTLDIEIYRADHTAYSKKLNKVVMMRDVPDHTKEDFILLSGTAVRTMLSEGKAPPPEFSRPEVAQILMDYYQSTQD